MESGTRLGPYEILEPLGKGGMGEVYRARDPSLKRDVAIKVLPEAVAADRERIARLKREAHALAALNHPNVATIHSLEETDEAVFLVLELVEGETLAERLRSGALDVEEALELAIQIAEGLEAAHARGIIHRDLKPANVKITPEGRVKVLDFGLARPSDRGGRRVDPSETPTATVAPTGTGVLMGTAGYMSPEQVREQGLDERTDIWSFGCVLYEMLSGERAFQRETISDTLASVLKEEPRWTALPDETPAQIDSLLRRCLRKDRGRRLQNVGDARIEIEDILVGPREASTSVGERMSRTSPRRPGPAASRSSRATLALIALAIVGIGGVLVYAMGFLDRSGGHVPAEASVAVLPFEDRSPGRDNEYFSEGISETLISMLSDLENLQVASRTSSFAFRGQDVDVREIGRRLGVATVLEGTVAKSGDKLRILTQLIDASSGFEIWSEVYEGDLEDVFSVQERIARAITDALRVELVGEADERFDTVGTESLEAYNLYLLGRHAWNQRTSQGILTSIVRFEEALGLDPDFAMANVGLADAYCIAGFYDYLSPREAFPECRRAAERALAVDPANAEAHNTLGYVALYFDWDQTEAEREFKTAIDLDPRYPVAHQWYSNLLVTTGDFEEAAIEMSLAAQLDPLSMIATAGIGWVHFYAGNGPEALKAFDVALEMDPNFYITHLWRGWTLERMGEHENAVRSTERAIELSDRSPNTVASLAYIYASDGQRQAAEALIGELEEEGGSSLPYELAKVYLALGDEARGMELLNRAYEDRSHSLVFLKVDPHLEPWRSHPAFTDLVDRVGLE